MVSFSHRDRHLKSHWVCRCQCGNLFTATRGNLTSGNTTSCGCERIRKLRAKLVTHGQAPKGRWTKEYRTWVNMITRCYRRKPDHRQYKDYAGRGITVCQEWRDSFVAFFAHVGKAPGPKLTLDRIDNDKGYFPGNVRWATRREQRLNSRPKTI